jgi:2-oxoisovalerate dehydrogenase E1 component
MHIADVAKGNLGATGIVGGNIPVATGAALSMKLQGTDQVVLCFFGDGASNTGNFHEALNMASAWKLPGGVRGGEQPLRHVGALCQRLLRARRRRPRRRLRHARRGRGRHGPPGRVRGGRRRAERARRGEGPALIECKTYRWYGHSRSDPRVYRTKEEEQEWRDSATPSHLRRAPAGRMGVATQEELDEVEERAAQAAIEAATEFALASPLPDPAEVEQDVYASAPHPRRGGGERQRRERVRTGEGDPPEAYWEAIRDALRRRCSATRGCSSWGGRGSLRRGLRRHAGLYEEFGPERVRDTPISEALIGGAAVGAAMTGLRPVAEIMYVDFTPLAMDQIANQGAKNRYMFGGKTTVPMVIRTEGGAGRSIAAHHSQSLEALWMHFPGIYVVMPATPYDAKGLLKAAIRDDNPVMFIEHKMLYGTKGPVPEEDYVVPLGVADVKREGSDVTIVTYSRMVLRALEAAEAGRRRASASRSSTCAPSSRWTWRRSWARCARRAAGGRDRGLPTGSFISELFTLVNEVAFDWLDAPMVRVAARPTCPCP